MYVLTRQNYYVLGVFVGAGDDLEAAVVLQLPLDDISA